MPLLRAGKKAGGFKREPLYAAVVTVCCLMIIFLTVQSRSPICATSCYTKASSSQLVGQALHSITARTQRSNPSDADASTTGNEVLTDEHDVNHVRLSSVPRTVQPTLDSRTQVTLPLSIWQSVPFREANSLIISALFKTWTVQHPEWDHFVVDVKEMRSYVQEHVEPGLVKLFWAMPTEQMRADAFRFASFFLACFLACSMSAVPGPKD